jgi:hypothetical protein
MDYPTSDPYLSPTDPNPAELNPRLKRQLKELLVPPVEESSSNGLHSRGLAAAEPPVDPKTEAPGANPKEDQQNDIIPEDVEHLHPFSWCDKWKPLCSWEGSSAHSEFLILSIVVLFILVVLAWEGVGRSFSLLVSLISRLVTLLTDYQVGG